MCFEESDLVSNDLPPPITSDTPVEKGSILEGMNLVEIDERLAGLAAKKRDHHNLATSFAKVRFGRFLVPLSHHLVQFI
jgi:hypothetical protein